MAEDAPKSKRPKGRHFFLNGGIQVKTTQLDAGTSLYCLVIKGGRPKADCRHTLTYVEIAAGVFLKAHGWGFQKSPVLHLGRYPVFAASSLKLLTFDDSTNDNYTVRSAIIGDLTETTKKIVTVRSEVINTQRSNSVINSVQTLWTQDSSDPRHFGTIRLVLQCPDTLAPVPECLRDSLAPDYQQVIN